MFVVTNPNYNDAINASNVRVNKVQVQFLKDDLNDHLIACQQTSHINHPIILNYY